MSVLRRRLDQTKTIRSIDLLCVLIKAYYFIKRTITDFRLISINFNRATYERRANNALHMEYFVRNIQLLWIIYSNSQAVCTLLFLYFYRSCILLFLLYGINVRRRHLLYCLVEFMS